MARRVFTRFGNAEERTVQEICDAIGGDVVYLVMHGLVVPVHSWRRKEFAGSSERGKLQYVAKALAQCHAKGREITAFGADRTLWTVKLSSRQAAPESAVMDMESDSSQLLPATPIRGSAMRKEF